MDERMVMKVQRNEVGLIIIVRSQMTGEQGVVGERGVFQGIDGVADDTGRVYHTAGSEMTWLRGVWGKQGGCFATISSSPSSSSTSAAPTGPESPRHHLHPRLPPPPSQSPALQLRVPHFVPSIPGGRVFARNSPNAALHATTSASV